MRVGYGRGYYGEGQLVQPPTSRRGSGWGKLALVVGVGAVIWLMWPRKPEHEAGPGDNGPGDDEPKSPLTPPSPIDVPVVPVQAAPQFPQVAEMRDFSSQQAYEDAVVASARQLQAAGAKIVMAPHLAHLAPRLVP